MNTRIDIRAASAGEVIDLRHAVLRDGLPRESAVFDGDDHPEALHFVAIDRGSIVGCVTLHPSTFNGEPAWQLRGMAVAPAVQRKGIGAALMETVQAVVASDPARRVLWCNARVPASGFYQRHGWQIVSEVFDIPSAGPHVRMTRPL